MNEKTLDNVVLDLCPSCGGIWLEREEFRKISGGTITEHELTYRGKSRLKCPKCSCVMNDSDLHSAIVEECPKGHGVFFEKGEAEKIFGHSKFKAPEEAAPAPAESTPLTVKLSELVEAAKGLDDEEKAKLIVKVADGIGILEKDNWYQVVEALSAYQLKRIKR